MSGCGIKVDNKTLAWKGNCLTVPGKNPNDVVKAKCGLISYDAEVFQVLDGVITGMKATEIAEPIDVCGEVKVDGQCFTKEFGNLWSFHEVEEKEPDDDEGDQGNNPPQGEENK